MSLWKLLNTDHIRIKSETLWISYEFYKACLGKWKNNFCQKPDIWLNSNYMNNHWIAPNKNIFYDNFNIEPFGKKNWKLFFAEILNILQQT